MAEEQRDLRRVATRLVSVAILATGALFGAFGVWFLRRPGGGSAAAGVALLLFGGLVALAALFFLLVPHRLDNLREMHREYEAEHGPYEDH